MKPNLTPILAFITGLLKKKAKPDIHKDKRQKIVLFLEKFNNAIKNPVIDVIVRAIPGHKDDSILTAIRFWLPQVLSSLSLTEDKSNIGIAIFDAVKAISQISKPERAGYIKMIGGDLYERFSGIELGQAIEDIQKEYDIMKQGGLLG